MCDTVASEDPSLMVYLFQYPHIVYYSIISQNMSSEAQVKNFFYFVEMLCSVLKIFSRYFCILNDRMISKSVTSYMRQAAFLNISFDP